MEQKLRRTWRKACKKAGKCLGKVKADKESKKGLAGKMTEGGY